MTTLHSLKILGHVAQVCQAATAQTQEVLVSSPEIVTGPPEVPVWRVEHGGEEPSGDRNPYNESSPITYNRGLVVRVELTLAAETVDDAQLVGAILGDRVQRLLLRSRNLLDSDGTPLAQNVTWRGSAMQTSDSGQRPTLSAIHELRVEYLWCPAQEDDPPVAAVVLTGIDVSWDLPGVGADVDAEDEVRVPGP